MSRPKPLLSPQQQLHYSDCLSQNPRSYLWLIFLLCCTLVNPLFLPSRYMCMESHDHSLVQWLARRTPRTQHIVLQLWFTIEKGYKAKSTKGKGTWGEIQKKPGASFQESFPSGVTQDMFNSSSRVVTARVKHLPQKLIRNSGPRGFFWCLAT